jgi:Lrp/AsnC family transcriptional regulator
MNAMNEKFDEIDRRILYQLQQDANLSQRELADRVGLSQNACWRRLKRLYATNAVKSSRVQIDLPALGLDLTVFVMVRTRHHSREWAEKFCQHVAMLTEVTDFYRMGGDWDYLLKVVTRGMSGYDRFYQKLTTGYDLETVTGYFPMENIFENRAVDLNRI